MAKDLNSLIERLGPAVTPFCRSRNNKELADGEGKLFSQETIDISASGWPSDVPTITDNADLASDKRYLWVIDLYEGKLRLRILYELTHNPTRKLKQIVCHTNITGGATALQGGELWFGKDGKLYINAQSGRYGAKSQDQWNAVKEFFNKVLKKELISIDDIFG
jgi:hypothetical protein